MDRQRDRRDWCNQYRTGCRAVVCCWQAMEICTRVHETIYHHSHLFTAAPAASSSSSSRSTADGGPHKRPRLDLWQPLTSRTRRRDELGDALHRIQQLSTSFVAMEDVMQVRRQWSLLRQVWLRVFVSVCVCVCESVCFNAYLKNPTTKFFSARWLWPWLGPPLVALRYVV